MLEDLLFSGLMLSICFTFLYIMFCLMYLFQFHNVTEKEMIDFYKKQWRKNKSKKKKVK